MSVHVSIGNSDDRLTQARWAAYVADVDDLVREHAAHVHGQFFTAPDVRWQSATWAFEITAASPSRREWLRHGLARLAATYRQDSIAWTEGKTEMIAGTEPIAGA